MNHTCSLAVTFFTSMFILTSSKLKAQQLELHIKNPIHVNQPEVKVKVKGKTNEKGLYKNSEGTVKPIDLFNLSASYKINNQWTLGLGVENLLNKDYYPVISQYRALDAEYVKGTGTTASININYKF